MSLRWVTNVTTSAGHRERGASGKIATLSWQQALGDLVEAQRAAGRRRRWR